MWQLPVDDLLKLDPPTDIPPLKLNPYEVLEPQKVDLKENILVDLSQDEAVKKSDANLEMGSFLDTVTKKDYNLLDLFQNIFVTPQHVQKSSTKIDTDSLIDFGDKLENKNTKTVQETVATDTSLDKSGNIHDFDALIHRTVVSFPVIDIVGQKTEESVEINPQNIIPEKTDPKIPNHFHETSDSIYRSSTSKLDIGIDIPEKNAYDSLDTVKTLKNPPIDIEKPIKVEYKTDESEVFKTDYDYIDYYMSKQLIDNFKVVTLQNTLVKDSFRDRNQLEVKDDNLTKCDFYNSSKILNLNKSMDKFLIDPSDNDVPVNHSKDLKKPKAINMLSNNQFNQIKSGQLLQTVVKDEKLYAKQRNLKENNRNLTKGPDIYEKSIVLPQIMERLASRKNVLDRQRELKRRLVLDTGVTPTKCKENVETVKTEVLMADCNKKRVANLRVRQSFEKFIKTGLPH